MKYVYYTLIFLFLIGLFVFYFNYYKNNQTINQTNLETIAISTTTFTTTTTTTKSCPNVTINTTVPLLFENFRWYHMPLKVYFNDYIYETTYTGDAYSQFLSLIKEGMYVWQNRSNGTVSFQEVSNAEDADITVNWMKLPKYSGNSTSGSVAYVDTSDFKIVDTGLFNLTYKGAVWFSPICMGAEDYKYTCYSNYECTNRAMSTHEFGHLLGFTDSFSGCSLNGTNIDIMDTCGGCTNIIFPSRLQYLKDVYSINTTTCD